MWALLFLTPTPFLLVDRLELSPSYAISAVYYAEGERVSSDVMTLDVDDWVILKLAYAGHTSTAADAAQTASTLISQVCEAQCPPCAELTPAARARIDELLDMKEAVALQLRETKHALTMWRTGAVVAGVVLTAALVFTIAY